MKNNNKLIAEFLGWDINSPSTFPIHLHQEEETQGHWEFKFDTDWNWLMEVVDKIDSLGYIFKLQGNSATFFKNKTFKEPIWNDSFIGNTKIEATYNAVVEFIKWYNEQ